MGYNKAIIYGNNFELYQYEKERFDVGERSKRERIKRPKGQDLASSRANSLSSEEGQTKRQDNARRASRAFRLIVASNLGNSAPPLLVTLTYRYPQTHLSQGYRHYTTFIKNLRYVYGKSFRFCAVPEFQKNGRVHFHALIWDLPESVFFQERKTRQIAKCWGQGYVFLKQTDGNDRLSSYLSKYMAKAFTDSRLAGQKAYTCSRNCLRPVVVSGFSPVWPILDDWGVDNSSCSTKEYMTQWLGQAKVSYYKLIENK